MDITKGKPKIFGKVFYSYDQCYLPCFFIYFHVTSLCAILHKISSAMVDLHLPYTLCFQWAPTRVSSILYKIFSYSFLSERALHKFPSTSDVPWLKSKALSSSKR